LTDFTAGTTVPAMPPTMVIVIPTLATTALIRRVRISLPRIDCLVDDVKYHRAETLPPARGAELRALHSPHLARLPRPRPPVRVTAP
jgi:hypothetical protein